MAKFGLKEKITSFLLKEDGKISKKNLLKVGIIIGALAFSSRVASAHSQCAAPTAPNGDCPNLDANTIASPQCAGGTHNNAVHANNLNVKNMFGKLVLGHGNCIETHGSHGNHNSYHGNGGHGAGGWC